MLIDFLIIIETIMATVNFVVDLHDVTVPEAAAKAPTNAHNRKGSIGDLSGWVHFLMHTSVHARQVWISPEDLLDLTLTLQFSITSLSSNPLRLGLPKILPSQSKLMDQYVEEMGGDRPIYRYQSSSPSFRSGHPKE